MTTTTPKKGMKAFKATKTGKFFHVRSTLLTPFYPGHAEAFKLAADMVLDSHEGATTGPHNDKLLYPHNLPLPALPGTHAERLDPSRRQDRELHSRRESGRNPYQARTYKALDEGQAVSSGELPRRQRAGEHR